MRFTHHRIVVEGGDGSGKTTLAKMLRNMGFTHVLDRGEMSKATDDPNVGPEPNTTYLFIQTPVKVAYQRILLRGTDLDDPFHQMDSLRHYEQRFNHLLETSFRQCSVQIDGNQTDHAVLCSALKVLVPAGERLRFGLPSGRLAKHYHGLSAYFPERVVVWDEPNLPVTWVKMRTKAYPAMCAMGTLDAAVVGSDVLRANPYMATLGVISRTPQVGVRVVFAGKTPEFPKVAPLRVGTPFPEWASQELGFMGRPHVIYHVNGGSEGLVNAGICDVIFDIVESGETLRSNGLVLINGGVNLDVCVIRGTNVHAQ